jgi:predicted Zn finger-like uncharacterized protein
MAFWSVQERVGIEVRHVIDQEHLGDIVTTTHYCATSLVVQRPEHGTVGERVRCGHCGETFQFTVCSARRSRQRRAWSFGIGIVLLGSGVGLGFASLLAVGQAAFGFWSAVVSVVATVFLFAAGLGGVLYSLLFPGVRSKLAGLPWQPGSHFVNFELHADRKRRHRCHHSTDESS